MDKRSYESYREESRERSKGGWYSAVVEIVRYLSNNGPVMTVVTGRSPITTVSRRGEFRGVVCQFFNGEPFGTVKVKPADEVIVTTGDDPIPF